MLRKLLKYDLRANMKIYCVLWPSLVIAAILQRLLSLIDTSDEVQSFLLPLAITLLMFSISGSVIGSMVICVTRFYKGLLKEEGYLMFTLPVHPWQLILSKLLVSMMTIMVTGLLSFGSILLLSGSFADTKSVLSLFFSIGGIITESNIIGSLYIIVFAILYQALSILQIYMACAIGHLVEKHRIIVSIAVWFGLNYGQQFFILFFGVMVVHVSLWFVLLGVAIVDTLFFYFTQRILKKRLNLE